MNIKPNLKEVIISQKGRLCPALTWQRHKKTMSHREAKKNANEINFFKLLQVTDS